MRKSTCNNKRSYCTHCNGKFYQKDLKKVYYKLLHKEAFHCYKCMSTLTDNLQYFNEGKDQYLLELFSGSGTVSRVSALSGFKFCSIDIEARFNPTITKDISKLSIKEIPDSNKIFIIWASLPCTYYSVLNCSEHWQKLTYSHRQYYYIPKTKEARAASILLEKVLWLIRKLNPVYYIIENPRGALRHMPQMQSIPFINTVSYADYNVDSYKPTDLFHNIPFLKLCTLKSSVGRSFTRSISHLQNSYERSKVPEQLIQSIINQIICHHHLKSSKCANNLTTSNNEALQITNSN